VSIFPFSLLKNVFHVVSAIWLVYFLLVSHWLIKFIAYFYYLVVLKINVCLETNGNWKDLKVNEMWYHSLERSLPFVYFDDGFLCAEILNINVVYFTKHCLLHYYIMSSLSNLYLKNRKNMLPIIFRTINHSKLISTSLCE
jgi:hypothetical protein